jgi:hypothetical protein
MISENELRQIIVQGFLNCTCGIITVDQIRAVTNAAVKEAEKEGLLESGKCGLLKEDGTICLKEYKHPDSCEYVPEVRCTFKSAIDNAQCLALENHLNAHYFDEKINITN